MTNLISFPFRLTDNGRVAVTVDGSDQCFAEELAVLCLTRPGERELVPQFGLTDPTFGSFDQTELVGKVRLFIPDVTVKNVQSSYPQNGEQRLVIEYDSLVSDFKSEDTFNG